MRRVSFAKRYPKLARQWHPSKNGKLAPEDVPSRSQLRVWWKCDQGPDHEWQTQVNSRTYGDGCPFCSGRRASRDHSLAKAHPDLARQWHPSKNGALSPSDLTPQSNRHVWWKCPRGPDHEWKAPPGRRVAEPGCPFCGCRRTAAADSLAALEPEIVRQWHPTRNGTLTPRDVRPGAEREVWWKCKKGRDHEWKQPVRNRVRAVYDCPFCANQRVSVTNTLARRAPELARQWHPTRNRGLSPNDMTLGGKRQIWWKCPAAEDHEWRSQIGTRLRSPRCPFCVSQRLAASNSLAGKNPALARQWHPTKNGKLTPRHVSAGSTTRVWWSCKKGPDHEWRTSVAQRQRTGCAFCSHQKLSAARTLARLFPVLARQWHPTKNRTLTPADVGPGTPRIVWWKCERGPDHEWRAAVSNRTKPTPTGCPFCARKRPDRNTSFAVRHPARARFWHPTKNGELEPSDVLPASNRPVFWKCPGGPDHEWTCTVSKMTRCPFCANRRVSVTNCLATKAPRVARQWHPTKNGALRPSDVLPSSKLVVFWKCDRGPDHEWELVVWQRVRSKVCPFCLGRRVSATNSLAGVYPALARRWHPLLNRRLSPHDVFATTWQYVWWLCPVGHAFKARVREQKAGKLHCPLCAGALTTPRRQSSS